MSDDRNNDVKVVLDAEKRGMVKDDSNRSGSTVYISRNFRGPWVLEILCQESDHLSKMFPARKWPPPEPPRAHIISETLQRTSLGEIPTFLSIPPGVDEHRSASAVQRANEPLVGQSPKCMRVPESSKQPRVVQTFCYSEKSLHTKICLVLDMLLRLLTLHTHFCCTLNLRVLLK